MPTSEEAKNELIAAIYVAAAEQAARSLPLELLAALTRSERAFVARFDRASHRGAITASFNVEPHFIQTYAQIYAPQNPWLARAAFFQAEGLVWRGSDILALDELKETEFFRLFLYGQAVENTAHAVIRVRGTEIIHLLLGRRPQGPDYDDAALDLCRLYAGHAAKALAIEQSSSQARLVSEGFAHALGSVGIGAAVLDAAGTVLEINRACLELIAAVRGEPVAATPHPSFPLGRAADARFPRAIVTALATRPIPRSLVLEPRAGDLAGPVSVNFRPISAYSRSGTSVLGTLMTMRCARMQLEADQAVLRSAFALTAAEARICGALVDGASVQLLSQKLGISEQTARTHLKRIFDKTGTTRQSELVRILMAFSCEKPDPGRADAALSGVSHEAVYRG